MQTRLLSAAALLGTMSLGALLFFFDPQQHGFYPQCQFHALTGLECPGCGSLRALHALLHGHLLQALHLNALFILSLPLCAALAAKISFARLRAEAWNPGYLPALAFGAGGLVVAFGVIRNLPFDCFSWLRP